MDGGRLGRGRHALLMCIREVLQENNVQYSMPTFRSGSYISAPADRTDGNNVAPQGTDFAPPHIGIQQAVGRFAQSAPWNPLARS